ncbi:hypothetical protein [Caballeronia sp. M23-90]
MPVMQNFDDPPMPGTVGQIIGEHLYMTDAEAEALASAKVTVLQIFDISGPSPEDDDWGAFVRIETGDESGDMKAVPSCDLYMVMQ